MSFENINILKNYSLNDLAKLVFTVGEANVQKLIKGVEADAKYGSETVGNFEAIINKLTPGVYDKILKNELIISVKEGIAELTKPVDRLFDHNGRRIKSKNLVSNVCDADRDFYLKQPRLDFRELLVRLLRCTNLKISVTPEEFKQKSAQLIDAINSEERTNGILNGAYFPIIIPKTDLSDLGEMVEALIKATEMSYRDFSRRNAFTNETAGKLKNQIDIIKGSRYEVLVDRIKHESVVGIYFPTALQGYSVNADIEQMESLPERFILSGPLDVSMAIALYPWCMVDRYRRPRYKCSSTEWKLSKGVLSFKSFKDKTRFDCYITDTQRTFSGFSGGLLVID